MWSFSLILVLLGAVEISSYESGCPDFNGRDLCECKEYFGKATVYCTDRDLTMERLTSSLQKLNKRKIYTFWVTFPETDVVPSTLFQDIDTEIKEVVVSRSKIGSFSDDRPFQGLENSLQKLTIFEGTIGRTFMLGHLQKLREFRLQYSTIPEITGDLFEEGMPSLRDVVVWHNTPRKMRNDAFVKLTNLKTLSILGQTLETLERSLLPNPAPALEMLFLRETETSDIDEDFFTNMPALDALEFGGNKISTIDESVFKPIWKQLVSVALNENPIVCDSRLNWLLKVTKPYFFRANCQSPEELRGREVGDLPEGKTEYDP